MIMKKLLFFVTVATVCVSCVRAQTISRETQDTKREIPPRLLIPISRYDIRGEIAPLEESKTLNEPLGLPRMRTTPLPPGAYPRLTHPLVRENGVLRPASWDEALDRAAEGFKRNLAWKGRTATGIFSCSKSTNEVNFLASKFARAVFGNNNVDSCNRT